MKELFVPYEIAVELKEKGFDEPCLANYDNDQEFYFIDKTIENTNSYYDEEVSTPLYQQVIDWFREKHKVYIYFNGKEGMMYSYQIGYFNKDKLFSTIHNPTHFEKYYESVEDSIKEALKLI